MKTKTIKFDEKAVLFLEEYKDKLGLKNTHDVITVSLDLLKALDNIEEYGCQLILKNDNSEEYSLSLKDLTDQLIHRKKKD